MTDNTSIVNLTFSKAAQTRDEDLLKSVIYTVRDAVSSMRQMVSVLKNDVIEVSSTA